VSTVAETPWTTLKVNDLVQDSSGETGVITQLETIRGFNTLHVRWPDQSGSYYPFANQCTLTYIGRQ